MKALVEAATATKAATSDLSMVKQIYLLDNAIGVGLQQPPSNASACVCADVVVLGGAASSDLCCFGLAVLLRPARLSAA